MNDPPIFTVRYFDADWEEDEDLLMEDCTAQEVRFAVSAFAGYHAGEPAAWGQGGGRLAKIVGLSVEVQGA